MEIKKVGIVGYGIAGSDWVQACVQSGYLVTVTELNHKLLDKGLASTESSLTESVKAGKLSSQDKDTILSRINCATDIQNISDCDFIVENINENLDMKKKLFTELDKICPKNVVLASNTSGLSIIDMAAQTQRPDKVVGVHGMPVANSFIEIIKSITTSDETLEATEEFCKSLGTEIVVAKDIPGAILLRLWMPFMLEAMRMVEQGVATAEDIDKSFTSLFGWSKGPLTVADMASLDNTLDVALGLYEQTKDSRYFPPAILHKMVTAGWYGRKTGKGFFNY